MYKILYKVRQLCLKLLYNLALIFFSPGIMSSLEPEYYTRCLVHDEYAVYKPIVPSLVLISSSGHPIASISMNTVVGYSSVSKSNRTMMVRDSSGIQAVCLDDCQRIGFVITNLTTSNHIAINLMRGDPTNYTARDTNPGPVYSINEINELSAGRSYFVRADQSTKQSMVLCSYPSSNRQDASVSDEVRAIWVTVIPRIDCPQLKQAFASCRWVTLDYIVRHEPATGQSMTPASARSLSASACGMSGFSSSRGYLEENTLSAEPNLLFETPRLPTSTVTDCAAIYPSGHNHHVYSQCTGLRYDYHLQKYTKISFAVNRRIRTRAMTSSVLPDYVHGWISALETSRVPTFIDDMLRLYYNDECCICLEPNPDTIIMACGHRCLHNRCIHPGMRVCPYCQITISGTYVLCDKAST